MISPNTIFKLIWSFIRSKRLPQVEVEITLCYITWHGQHHVSGQGRIRSRGLNYLKFGIGPNHSTIHSLIFFDFEKTFADSGIRYKSMYNYLTIFHHRATCCEEDIASLLCFRVHVRMCVHFSLFNKIKKKNNWHACVSKSVHFISMFKRQTIFFFKEFC